MSLLDQVRATIAQHDLCTRGDTVVVGVSGGADSLALLHALRALREELGIALHVAHLNHQLRGAEADADADFVAALARAWDLPATIESRDVAALARAEHRSIEQAARQARYAFLAEVAQRIGARVIAVAHHADDQAETVLMHLLRGAGMAGLRGMRYKAVGSGQQAAGSGQQAVGSRQQAGVELRTSNFELRTSNLQSPISNLQIVRPLLDVTRAEIEEYCRANALTPRFDRSNLDTTLFRNRLRHETLPYLETLNPNLRAILRRTARVLADDYDFLDAQTRAAYAQVAREEDGAIVFALDAWRALHPALQRGALRRAVQRLRRDLRDVDWTHVEDARRVALEKSTGAQATLPRGLMLTIGYTELTIADATRDAALLDLPLLRVERVALPREGVTALPQTDWVVETSIVREQTGADRWTAFFDLAACRGEVYLRGRQPGDRFQPAGMGGHSQAARAFMINAKIPHAVRDQLPLLVIGDCVAWVCGWRVDERVRATGEAHAVWRVAFRKREASRAAAKR